MSSPSIIGDWVWIKAQKYQLRLEVIAAIIYQESKVNPWAIRYEPAFFKHYIEPLTRKTLPGFVPYPIPTLSTEKRSRAISWGLMQVMGETARETGYKDKYLSKLTEIPDNLEIGCKYLRRLINLYAEHHVDLQYRKALLRWNGGGDSNYPNKIFKHVASKAYKDLIVMQ